MATGQIRFEYDREHDIHIAYPEWTIDSEADCKTWYNQYVDYFEKLGKKVDVIFVLDNFNIGKSIGSTWGRYRAEANRNYTRHSVRVHLNARVATFTATSATIHNAPADEARDIPSAIELIEAMRKRSPG